MTVVCSNCHHMIHRWRNKILSIDELKQIISQNAAYHYLPDIKSYSSSGLPLEYDCQADKRYCPPFARERLRNARYDFYKNG